MNKLILIDVDGVVLNYNTAFANWMAAKGYGVLDPEAYNFTTKFGLSDAQVYDHCDEFSNSDYIGNLEPVTGAIYYINKLYLQHGYKFHFITSISAEPNIVTSRVNNLRRHLLPGLFKDVTCLGFLENKKAYLKEHYENSNLWWIEDSVTNYVDGIDVGLRGLLVDHPYNISYNTDNRVHSWDEIYDRITA